MSPAAAPVRLGSTRAAGARRRAFTLAELLVVLAVVALMLAMLGPPLARSRALARDAVCRAGLRQVHAATFGRFLWAGRAPWDDTEAAEWIDGPLPVCPVDRERRPLRWIAHEFNGWDPHRPDLTPEVETWADWPSPRHSRSVSWGGRLNP